MLVELRELLAVVPPSEVLDKVPDVPPDPPTSGEMPVV
jgi:hypothetical protein